MEKKIGYGKEYRDNKIIFDILMIHQNLMENIYLMKNGMEKYMI